MEQQTLVCADCDLAGLTERQYVPISRENVLVLTKARSRKILSIAYVDVPEERCGSALRIGYTGSEDEDKALYRLKVRGKGRHFFTLPLLYALEDGVFVSYEEEGASVNREIECFRCKKKMYGF
ncbi:MAG: hypothetical protein H0U76_03525 [Ktedonobacteraceae bacterium]|nr:hypothetical protein [Ktedonobacteraceae bacterium]